MPEPGGLGSGMGSAGADAGHGGGGGGEHDSSDQFSTNPADYADSDLSEFGGAGDPSLGVGGSRTFDVVGSGDFDDRNWMQRIADFLTTGTPRSGDIASIPVLGDILTAISAPFSQRPGRERLQADLNANRQFQRFQRDLDDFHRATNAPLSVVNQDWDRALDNYRATGELPSIQNVSMNQ